MFSVAAIHDAVKTVKTNAQEMMEHAKDNGIKIRHVDLCFQVSSAWLLYDNICSLCLLVHRSKQYTQDGRDWFCGSLLHR